ncbi:MAG: terminase small subunit [Planctomycetota bacterium]|jgi:phage terminase small subunit
MANKLKPRQDSFCVNYTTIGSDTYSNGTKAALAAGYSEKSAHVTATKLLKQEAIQKRIVELQAENMQRNMITVDKVLADLEHDKLMARENHQYAVAKACTELQGRWLAMFKDNLNQTVEGLNLNFTTTRTATKEQTPEERRQEIAERNAG